jgi:hypothetical protein
MKTLLEQFELIANSIGEHDKFNGFNLNNCNSSDATHIFND